MAAVAASLPASFTAKARPRSRKIRQSAAVWFQPASATSAPAASRSAPTRAASVLAIAGLEMRRLAEARAAARDPVGHPVEHCGERDARRPEQPPAGSGIDDPRRGCLGADDVRLLLQALGEFPGEPAHA